MSKKKQINITAKIVHDPSKPLDIVLLWTDTHHRKAQAEVYAVMSFLELASGDECWCIGQNGVGCLGGDKSAAVIKIEPVYESAREMNAIKLLIDKLLAAAA